MKMISIISMALLLMGSCIAAPSYTYDDFAQTVKGIYLGDTNSQILTHGNEVEIYVTNPQENATMQGLNDLRNSTEEFAKALTYHYNNITTVTAHVEFAYKGGTLHTTYIFTPKYILPGAS
jgi:hypothetical protein